MACQTHCSRRRTASWIVSWAGSWITIASEDRLIVLSDHGFNSFRCAVHLNRWLAEEGYLALKPGAPSSQSLFTNVDWTKSKAFALGLNGIFLNLSGREALGIVGPDAADALKRELSEKLKRWRDPHTGEPVVLTGYDGDQVYQGGRTADAPDLVIGYARGYHASGQTALGGVPDLLVEDNTRKWSGDHCIEPSLVPGVLFTSFEPPTRDRLDHRSTEPDPGDDGPHRHRRPSRDRTVTGRVRPGFARIHPDRRPHVRMAAGPGPALRSGGSSRPFASMGLYRLTSNQSRLADNKQEIAALQKKLADFDGPFSGLWPLLGRNFALAGRRLWLSLGPALIASVPVIFIIAWVANAFDAQTAGGGCRNRGRGNRERRAPAAAAAVAGRRSRYGKKGMAYGGSPGRPRRSLCGSWIRTAPCCSRCPLRRRQVRSINAAGGMFSLVTRPGTCPAPAMSTPYELGLPRSEFLPFGPAWMRGWMAYFFSVVIVLSLLLKFLWRLH